MKAKKIMSFPGKYSTVVEYEYRGKTYQVEYANNWTYCVTPASIQHRQAQEKIDAEILAESQPKKESKPLDIDEIWALMGWGK